MGNLTAVSSQTDEGRSFEKGSQHKTWTLKSGKPRFKPISITLKLCDLGEVI